VQILTNMGFDWNFVVSPHTAPVPNGHLDAQREMHCGWKCTSGSAGSPTLDGGLHISVEYLNVD